MNGSGPPGLLIVNADDWGHDEQTTDAILDCFQERRITSTTAMVHMADSDRAAAEATRRRLPVGLHLNLTEQFTDPAAPAGVRERQARLVSYFREQRLARWVYNPSIREQVDRCVADQLERFLLTYGCPPTHVDGHMHLHTCPNVLLSPALRPRTKVRLSFTFARYEKSLPNRASRAILNALIRHRFVSTDYFFSIRRLFPRFGGRRPDRLSLSAGHQVEVMVHPGWSDEHEFLLGDAWRAEVTDRPTGSYRELH